LQLLIISKIVKNTATYFGVRPYPLEYYIGKCTGEDLFSVARPDPVWAKCRKVSFPDGKA
jgi:hypothetical protein